MRHLSTAIAIALLGATGCYSPGYVDCTVRCSDGVCPSGYACDQDLLVCRPEGATGQCPAQSDDSGIATMDADLVADADLTAICGGIANARFCASFDVDPLAQQGFQLVQVGGATLSLVTSPRSAPNALQSLAPGDDNTKNIEARAVAAVSVPVFTTMSVAWDMNFAERVNALSPKTAFRVEVGGYNVTLYSSNATSAYTVIDDATAASQVFYPVQLGIWYRYELRYMRVAGALQIYLFRDNAPISGTGLIGTTDDLSSADRTWTVSIGAANQSSNGLSRFLYDNVLVTSTP